MATWMRTPRAVACHRLQCDREIPAGELVCLVSVAKVPTCRGCAKKVFDYDPPADVPALPAPRVQVARADDARLPLSDSVEPPPSAPGWARYDRKATIKKLLSARELKAANAVDPKLKQLGGDR